MLRNSTTLQSSAHFRPRLAAARVRKGFQTHREIAEVLGISRPFYTLIENGRRNPTTALLFRMAELLEISVEDVMATEEERSA